ncbi:MAG TPA: hypothetical protein VGI64_23125 [Streptosporangiaceae bacterium]
MSGLVLLAIFIGIVLAILAGDRAWKARAHARKREKMHGRLLAAVAKAEKQHQRHKASERASAALTSVIPAIAPPPLSLPDMEASASRRPTGGEPADQPEQAESTATEAGHAAGERVSGRAPDTPAS